MAKALRKPQPQSSMEKFLNPVALNAALEHHDEEESTPDLAELDSYVDPKLDAPQPQAAPQSVADATNARRGKVVGEIPRVHPPTAPETLRRGELVDRKRDFRLTKFADDALEELVTIYKLSTEADLTRSHVLRAVAKAIHEALPSIRREAQKIGPLKRPSNARGKEDQRDEFEGIIADAFRKGMRG